MSESPKKMRLITTRGVVARRVPDETDRSLVGRHASAVGRFLATGDTDVLAPFAEATVAGRRLESDPERLEAWASSGELEFEDLYPASEGGRWS